jgi:hypothetical protein
MKPFHCLVGLRQPAKDVAAAIRDRLPEIAPALQDVQCIRAISRTEQADGRVTLINEWRVNPKLPSALNGIVSPDRLGWLDHAEWSADLSSCSWRIEPYFMAEAIQCKGTTWIAAAMAGRGTRATFEGALTIDPTALSSVPAAWRQPAAAAVEFLIGTLIPRNFRRTADAVAALLARSSPDERAVMETQPRIGCG